jgi:dihydropteroate synthase
MQKEPHYTDVVREVGEFLKQRAEEALAAGIPLGRIVVDPGFGFGKTLEHNLDLLLHLSDLGMSGWPLLVGLSRKSMIGALMGGVPAGDRLHGSVAAAVVAVQRGAHIVRVHDVAATVQALKVAMAVNG